MRKAIQAIVTIGLLVTIGCAGEGESPPQNQASSNMVTQMSPELAARFADLALSCIDREYPNKIGHVFNSRADLGTPRDLHPTFYGCFDWHSAVHGHWLLVRLLHTGDQNAAWRGAAISKLNANITPANIAREVLYFEQPNRASYERPYGLAWLLQLSSELREWDDPQAKIWLQTLAPLEQTVVARIKAWLPKLAYPIRLGTHNQSAFAFGLMLDYARASGDTELENLITEKSRSFHLADKNCPLAYEPSGEDFLSPCLQEADLMRRILSRDEYAKWLSDFLPAIPTDGRGDWLEPGIVHDATDGKLVHLDGVNLSRAWNLENIAASLHDDDPRRAALLASAKLHKQVGLEAVSDAHYSGSHWLASFATYLMTKRGQ